MDDVDNVVALDSDPEVMRYISGGLPTPREEIETDFLPAWLSYYERFAGYGFWAAHEKSSSEFLGWFHFRPPPGHEPEDVELGYRLRKSAWGKGYATEGSRALIAKGFNELGVRRVFAFTMVINAAPRRPPATSSARQRWFHAIAARATQPYRGKAVPASAARATQPYRGKAVPASAARATQPCRGKGRSSQRGASDAAVPW